MTDRVVNDNLILLVDDDPDFLDLLDRTIRMGCNDQYEIIIARDGPKAQEAFTNNTPHLTFLDIMLPQKSGFLVLEAINEQFPQRRRANPRVPPYVVMITGNPGRRHKQYAESLGSDDYLQKPVDGAKILEVTRKYMGQ